MKYKAHWVEHLRAAIITALAAQPCYSCRASMLVDLVNAATAMHATLPDINDALTWLAGEGLVAQGCRGGLAIAELTERGADAAYGRIAVAGVQPPPTNGSRP